MDGLCMCVCGRALLELNMHCFSMNMRALSTILKHLCGFNRISTCCFRCLCHITLTLFYLLLDSICSQFCLEFLVFIFHCIHFLFYSPSLSHPLATLLLSFFLLVLPPLPLACVTAYSLLLYHHSQREIRRELWRFVNRNSFCIQTKSFMWLQLQLVRICICRSLYCACSDVVTRVFIRISPFNSAYSRSLTLLLIQFNRK